MILDIILILLFLIIGFIGYKIGFLTTLLKLTSALSGIIIAICLTKPVTNLAVIAGWDSAMENKIFTNITTSDVFVAYTEGGEGVNGINNLLQELGIPAFMSGIVANGIAESINPTELARQIADGVSYVVTFVITFFALLLFSSLIFLILKLVVKSVREAVGFVRIVDGILGVIFYILMFIIILNIVFLIISLILQGADPNGGFASFFLSQLHLDDGNFGVAKYLYQNNMLGNFFGLLF
jgi:hypothetical protein